MDKTTKLTPQILAMYLGCRVAVRLFDKSYFGVVDGVKERLVFVTIDGDKAPTSRYLDQCKPILRRLSSMTEEEAQEFKKLIPWMDFKGFTSDNCYKYVEYEEFSEHEQRPVCTVTSPIHLLPISTVTYLLSKSFDLFGLIDSGEAIDSQTLK